MTGDKEETAEGGSLTRTLKETMIRPQVGVSFKLIMNSWSLCLYKFNFAILL